jgi:hypothetical protein
MQVRWLLCIGAILLLGCAERQRMDCPDGLEVDTSHMDHSVRAKYTSEQANNRIIIRAAGELPAGYEAVFVRSAKQTYPPEFTLMRHGLHGQYPAMEKNFESCVAFEPTAPVEEVTVNDAVGPHVVKIGR